MTKTQADTLLGISQCLATLARHEQAVTGGTYVAEQAAQRLALLAEQVATGGTVIARPRGARARAAWKITAGVLMSLWLLSAFAGGGWMPWPLFILVPWGVGLFVADINRRGLALRFRAPMTVSEVRRRHG